MKLKALIALLESARRSQQLHPAVILTDAGLAQVIGHLQSIADARAYDEEMDATERSPTGDDYSEIFNFIGTAASDPQPVQNKILIGIAEGAPNVKLKFGELDVTPLQYVALDSLHTVMGFEAKPFRDSTGAVVFIWGDVQYVVTEHGVLEHD